MTPVYRKSYPPPPIDEKAVLRYAGCREASADMLALLRECREMAEPVLTYRLLYRELPLTVAGNDCTFGSTRVRSASLASHMMGCGRVILLAATVGLGLDRLITKQSRLSPSHALMLQALGAERIEALCDLFSAEMAEEKKAAGLFCRSRFSPGYGDLPLSLQVDLFSLLDCERSIGLTLTGSGMMSPTKSVTALIGVKKQELL